MLAPWRRQQTHPNVSSIGCRDGDRDQRPPGLGSPALARRAPERRPARASRPRRGGVRADGAAARGHRSADRLGADRAGHRRAVHASGRDVRARPRRRACLRRHGHRERQVARVHAAAGAGAARAQGRALALPEPDEGPRAGSGAPAVRAAARACGRRCTTATRRANGAPLARKWGNPILTNPDMLHVGILPNHARWAEVLRSLTHVVVDEAHVYRGVFGSHVALVLRRLRRVVRHVRREPRRSCSRPRPSRTPPSWRAR